MGSKQKHIHVVGCSPRSGTTLMQELMAACFEMSDYCEHEISIFKSQDMKGDLVCTKHPREMVYLPWLLKVDPGLYGIYMLRDPRSVITSKHRKSPDKYFASLLLWKENEELRRRFKAHKRFLMVKYEDLVSDPDTVQKRIMEAMPFLKLQHKFSEFHKHAKPSDRSSRALNGLRPISSDGLSKWKSHLPRIKSEMNAYGDFSDRLIELGYEKDKQWMMDLDGVEAVEYESEAYNHRYSLTSFKMTYRAIRKTVKFTLRNLTRKPVAK